MSARLESDPAEYHEGVYSQLYHEFVQPARIWAVSKYFLRRWRPYLATPAQFWSIVAARQLAYRNQQRPWCQAHDSQMAAGSGLNVDHFRRRIKSQLNQETPQAIDLFLQKGKSSYQRKNGVTRPGPTRYAVRLDDPLTPADAAATLNWLRQEQRHYPQTPAGIQTLLTQALQLPASALLAAEPSHESPRYQAVTVSDIVAYLFPEAAQEERTLAAAETLHGHLTKPTAVHIETQYFREQWLPELGPGPALMLVELRSRGFYNAQTGEQRNEVSATLPELAETLKVGRKTLGRWLKRIEEIVVDQPVGHFLTELTKRRQGNQVAVTWRVAMQDPLTEADWRCYESKLALHLIEESRPNGQKVAHTEMPDETGGTKSRSQSNIGAYKKSFTPIPPDRQKIVHTTVDPDKKSLTTGTGRSETRPQALSDGQKVATGRSESRSIKYYNSLATAVNQDLNTFIKATGGSKNWLDEPLSVAVAVFVDKEGFVDQLKIQGQGREKVLGSNFTLVELVGWYLFALNQSWSRNPVGYLLQRVGEGAEAPESWLQLASLSWTQWRFLAAATVILGELPAEWVADSEVAGNWELWQELLGDRPGVELPFGIGTGLEAFDRPVYATAPISEPHPDSVIWREALQQLALELPRSTYQQWFPETSLLTDRAGHFVIACENDFGREWLAYRLRQPIERTLAHVTGQSVLSLDFVVADQIAIPASGD